MNTTEEVMLDQHLKARGINDPDVLQAMAAVDRKQFVPPEWEERAFEDRPLPIGAGQTISQPYIVAYMLQALRLKPDDVVFEAGAGCGYNAAVLSRIVRQVYSVEIIKELADIAEANLKKAEIDNVEVRHGDGASGALDVAPFDAVILTAAPAAIPQPLKDQLRIGGRLLAPVGTQQQELILLEKYDEDAFREHKLLPVRFVPMTGQAESGETA